jgi:hypothetical protein
MAAPTWGVVEEFRRVGGDDVATTAERVYGGVCDRRGVGSLLEPGRFLGAW